MKIKLNPNDDLPLKKMEEPYIMVIIRSVFNEDSKCYPHIFVDKYLYVS